MTELEASQPGEHPPPYIIFVVVFFFFLTGLFGFLICHLLKKKGYRCRTGDMSDDEEEEKIGGNAGDEDEQNQDTVEEILKCIIANEANMEAFNEMIGNRNVCVRHDPRLRKGSIGGLPPHLHTVHSGTDHNSCLLCAQVRSKKGRRQSRTPRFKQRPGEQTVFSVGRFRVTHHDKKLHGGPNALVSSGDQLDQSQDSDDRKESGYNLRNMFKEVGPTTESSNGLAPAVGKRKKSLTIFGLRRGSDPTGIRGGEGTGRETGGVRFAIQQQPVVPEEVLQTENVEVGPGLNTEPRVKPQTEPLKNEMSPSGQYEDQAIHSANSPSSETKTEREDSTGAPKAGSESPVKQRTSVPGYLPVPFPASSQQTFKSREKQGGAEGEEFKNEEDDDSGPLQTSTPIVPLHGSIPGSASVLPAGQTHSNTDFPVTQTPPDASSSPDGKAGYGTDLALISLGSSPASLFPNKTPSSVSSLKTPTSPLAVTLSPKLRSVNTPSEAPQTGFSPILTPSPKLQSNRVIPLSSFGKSSSPLQAQTPSPTPSSLPPADPNVSTEASPYLTLTLKPENEASVKAVAEGDMLSSLLSAKERKLEGTMKAKAQSAELLQTAQLSQGAAFSAAGQQGSSLPVTPFSPLSPSSPLGSRVRDVTIVKASPDSKREFAVVTMVDKEESSSSVKDQERKAPKPLSEPENVGSESAVGVAKKDPVAGAGQQESECGGTSGAADGLNASEKKDEAGVSKETALEDPERADEEKENI